MSSPKATDRVNGLDKISEGTHHRFIIDAENLRAKACLFTQPGRNHSQRCLQRYFRSADYLGAAFLWRLFPTRARRTPSGSHCQRGFADNGRIVLGFGGGFAQCRCRLKSQLNGFIPYLQNNWTPHVSKERTIRFLNSRNI
jgi:hypothetical protein